MPAAAEDKKSKKELSEKEKELQAIQEGKNKALKMALDKIEKPRRGLYE